MTKNPSIRSVLKRCLSVNTVGFASSTLRERGYVLRSFIAHSLSTKKVRQAIPLDLISWINSHKSWKSGWRRKGVAAMVKAALSWGERVGLIPRGGNPYKAVSYRANTRRRPATDAEIQSALRNSDPWFRRLVIFCAMTGARPGEVYKAEWEHIDLERATITLWEHKTASKTGEPRVIHLHPSLVRLLVWLARHSPHPRWILLNSKGGRWQPTAIHYRIERLRQRHGLASDFTLGCMRHRFATNAVLGRVDMLTLSKLLGHARLQTTTHYCHAVCDTKMLQDALGKIVAFRR